MLRGRLTSVLHFVGLLWIQAVVAADKEQACTIHDGDNFYNLNKLSAPKDYEFTSPGGHKFILNICKSVSHESWNLDVPNPQNVGGFIRRDHGDFSIGEANSVLEMKNGHPLLNLVGGSKCPKSDWQASTAIQFMCDTSVFSAGKPELVAQMPSDDDDACNFFIEWRTHFACPHGERGIISGPVAVLLLIILALGMLYLVFQTLWNRYALHLRGFDQMPTLPRKMTRFFSSVGSFFQASFPGWAWEEKAAEA